MTCNVEVRNPSTNVLCTTDHFSKALPQATKPGHHRKAASPNFCTKILHLGCQIQMVLLYRLWYRAGELEDHRGSPCYLFHSFRCTVPLGIPWELDLLRLLVATKITEQVDGKVLRERFLFLRVHTKSHRFISVCIQSVHSRKTSN